MRQNCGILKTARLLFWCYEVFYTKESERDVKELHKTNAKIRSFSMAYCKLYSL